MTPTVSHMIVFWALKQSPNLVYKKIKTASMLKSEHKEVSARFTDLH